MSAYRLIITVAAAILLTVPVMAADQDSAQAAPAELHAQTVCPVMGGKIDSTQYTDIQGQRIYHCCPMCSAKLKADPDKYFKEAAVKGVLFENIQTTCPVSGKTLKDKTVYTDYEGRRVYFCCPSCIPTFEKDPATYLSKLDKPVAKSGTSSRMSGNESDEGR
jgi:YHS domain-containing protein